MGRDPVSRDEDDDRIHSKSTGVKSSVVKDGDVPFSSMDDDRSKGGTGSHCRNKLIWFVEVTFGNFR